MVVGLMVCSTASLDSSHELDDGRDGILHTDPRK